MLITPHVKAYINTAALAKNFSIARSLCTGRRVFCVVKADAYGHTAEICVPALCAAGADAFAVSNTSEAVEVRELSPSSEVLILGWSDPSDVPVLIKGGIIQTAVDPGYLFALREAVAAAKSRGLIKDGQRLRVHLKLDTGMNRIGFEDSELDCAMRYLSDPHIDLCGAFTHLPRADMCDAVSDGISQRAVAHFIDKVRPLYDAKKGDFCRHFANSSSILRHGALFDCNFADCEAVRAGVILYGMPPSADVAGLTRALGFRPVMTLCSVVSHLHRIGPGEFVSYGGTWKSLRDTTVATVPAGYADGIPRLLSGKGHAFIHGKSYPIIGRVCMDQLMLDVTDADINVGDTVEFFGENEPDAMENIAAAALTINYEITCCINKRVARIIR